MARRISHSSCQFSDWPVCCGWWLMPATNVSGRCASVCKKEVWHHQLVTHSPQSGCQMADMAPVHPSLDRDAGWVQKCLYRNCARSESFIQIQVLMKVVTTSCGREEFYVCKEITFIIHKIVSVCILLYICMYMYIHIKGCMYVYISI